MLICKFIAIFHFFTVTVLFLLRDDSGKYLCFVFLAMLSRSCSAFVFYSVNNSSFLACGVECVKREGL